MFLIGKSARKLKSFQARARSREGSGVSDLRGGLQVIDFFGVFREVAQGLKPWARPLLACSLLLFALPSIGVAAPDPGGAQADIEPYAAHVVGVTDGDTVRVIDAQQHQHKVRLQGIDAPEKSQPYGQRAKASLAELVGQKDVWVDTHKHDRYGREVGRLLVDGHDMDLEQVRRGMAWHYKAYAREQPPEQRQSYAEAEAQARDAHRGLWADPDPLPPWEFRHRGKH